MDGPLDPLATARTGGLDSVVPLEEDGGRGFLGEVLVCEQPSVEDGLTAENVRGVKVTSLVSGYGKSFALDEEGNVIELSPSSCKRPEEESETELKENEGEPTTDMETNFDVPIAALAIGNEFGVGIGLEDDRLYSWGEGYAGQLGLGHTRGSNVPEVLSSVADIAFTQVSCGESHAAAVSENGICYTWGRGFEGQLGQGIKNEVDFTQRPFMATRLAPKSVQALSKLRISQVACGSRFTAVIDSSGAIWTFGEGLVGQLGIGRCTKRTVPVRVIGPCIESNIQNMEQEQEQEQYQELRSEDENLTVGGTKLSNKAQNEREDSEEKKEEDSNKKESGSSSESAEIDLSLDLSSTLTANQNNNHDNDRKNLTNDDKNTASEEISGHMVFKDISCGEGHVIAVDHAGKVCVWGFNAYGQLGLGDIESRYEPAWIDQKSVQSCVDKVCSNRYSSACRTKDGHVFTWGLNYAKKPIVHPKPTFVRKEKPDENINLAQITSTGGLLAMIPTSLSSVSPSNGPLKGENEISIHGVGFWESGCIKVRFIPMKRKECEETENRNSKDDNGEEEEEEDIGDQSLDVDLEEETGQDDESDISSSDSFSDELDDPRAVIEIDGWFDPATGAIKCIAPSCAATGIVQIQVAVDGCTYTNDQIFYIYTEQYTIEEALPKCILCSNDFAQEIATIAVQGTKLLAMPELCVRLSTDHGTTYTAKAQLVDDENALLANSSEQEILLRAQAEINVNQAIDVLAKDSEQHVVHAQVHVSLNGSSFEVPGQDAIEKCSITLSRVSIVECSPCSIACVSKEGIENDVLERNDVETESEERKVNDIVENGEQEKEQEKNHFFNELKEDADVVLHCKGLVPFQPSCETNVQIRLAFENNEQIFLHGLMDIEQETVTFKAPALDRKKWLLNGQGWGYRESTLQLSLDNGLSWALFSKPFIFYHGGLGTPKPSAIPTKGCSMGISVIEAHEGWLFPTAEPKIEVTVGDEKFIISGDENISISDDMNSLKFQIPSVEEAFEIARKVRSDAFYKTAFDAFLSENTPEQDENATEEGEPEPIDPQVLEEIREKADEKGKEALVEAFKEPIELNLRASINGVEFGHDIGKLSIFEHPKVDSIQPSSIVFEEKLVQEDEQNQLAENEDVVVDDDSNVKSEGKKEGGEDEEGGEVMDSEAEKNMISLTLSTSSGLFKPNHPVSVRFTLLEAENHVGLEPLFIDASVEEYVSKPPVEEQPTSKKKPGKKGSKEEEKATTEPSAEETLESYKKKRIVMRRPDFPVPGSYVVAVSWNSCDYSPENEAECMTFRVDHPPSSNDKADSLDEEKEE